MEADPPRHRQGVCVWFTGLSGAGKSTTAEILTELLLEHGRRVTLLDGDVVHTTFPRGSDSRREDRDIVEMRPIGDFATIEPMIRNHVIISGTGRAGTTFLVQLLTHLGLNTGFDINAMELYPIARAGLEMDIRDDNAPYIVKSPYLCDLIDEVLASSVRIEHAIIPVRQFDAAAASRAHIQKLTTGDADGKPQVNGGLWDTDEAHNQVGVLRLKFTRLIEALVRHDISMTF